MIVIGLGSNVGNREEMLDAAVAALGNVVSGMRVSSRMETPALLLPNAPPEWNMPFLNMAVAGECALPPRELLAYLKSLEVQLGRKDRGRWAPREIDLDILVYDEVVMHEADLTLPHPELLKREFALKPLLEVHPTFYPERTPHLLRGKSKDLSQRGKDPSASSSAKASEDESLGIKKQTKLVGILNLTPDSFSDGGKYSDVAAQIAALEQLVEDGADVVDVGAESTRPNATPLSSEEEWQRLQPFFAALKPEHFSTTLSLDTRHAGNAKRALDKGFKWINDVSGFQNAAMRDAVVGYDCTLVAMHSLTVPADKNVTLPEGCDVVEVLRTWVSGVSRRVSGNLIIDPGIGFGKTAAQSWQIIERIEELKALGFPLLIGHSRKSFLNSPCHASVGWHPRQTTSESPDVDPVLRRDDITLQVSHHLIEKEVDYLRVHDVAAHKALLA